MRCRQENLPQAVQVYGLHEVVVEAGFPRATAVFFLPIPREGYQHRLRQVSRVSKARGHFITAHVGKADIQQDHVRAAFPELPQGGGPVEGQA